MARTPLAGVTRSLTAVCMGREPADLVVTGGRLVDVHTRAALDWAGAAGLGEMMNMPGVLAGDEAAHAAIAATLTRGLPVTGHWSLTGWRDHRLHAYAAAGVDSCHETTTREDALAKLRAGMW